MARIALELPADLRITDEADLSTVWLQHLDELTTLVAKLQTAAESAAAVTAVSTAISDPPTQVEVEAVRTDVVNAINAWNTFVGALEDV